EFVFAGRPDRLARGSVVAEHALALGSPCEDRYHVVEDQWRRSEAPGWHLGSGIGDNVARPQHATGGGIEAVEPAGSALGIDLARVERRRGPWPGSGYELSEAGRILVDPALDPGGTV